MTSSLNMSDYLGFMVDKVYYYPAAGNVLAVLPGLAAYRVDEVVSASRFKVREDFPGGVRLLNFFHQLAVGAEGLDVEEAAVRVHGLDVPAPAAGDGVPAPGRGAR